MLSNVFLLIAMLAGCGLAGSSPISKATSTVSTEHQALYIGIARGSVISLRASDGSVRWKHSGFGYVWSPVINDSVAYVGDSLRHLLALHTDDGATIWQTVLDGPVAASPVFSEGTLYVITSGQNEAHDSPNGSLYAVDAHSGDIIWRFQSHGGLFMAPVVTDNSMYISVGDNSASGTVSAIFALNRADGSPRWHVEHNGAISGLAILDGTLYLGSTDKTIAALSATDGTQIWNHPMQGYVDSLTVTDAGVIYVGSRDENLYALQASNGDLLWTYHVDDFVLAPVAVRDGDVYVGSGNGFFAVLDGATGKARWRTCVDNKPCGDSSFATAWSTPVLLGETIYLGVTFSDPNHPHLPVYLLGSIYALDARNGSVRWRYDTSGGVLGTPALTSA